MTQIMIKKATPSMLLYIINDVLFDRTACRTACMHACIYLIANGLTRTAGPFFFFIAFSLRFQKR